MRFKAVAGILLLVLLGYGAIKAWPLVSGPSLSIDTPSNYTTFPEGFIRVSGKANHTENLSLNGGPLLIDPSGRFDTTLLFPEGGAILIFTATDRFGRSVTERRTVYVPITENHGIEEKSSEEGTKSGSTSPRDSR